MISRPCRQAAEREVPAPFSLRLSEETARKWKRRQIELIRQASDDSGKIHGYRKRQGDFLDPGESCCPDRIALLAKLARMKARTGSKRRPGYHGAKPAVMADYTLDRQFDVEAPDRARLADISAIRMIGGFAGLAGVINHYSRRVVGRSMQSRQPTEVMLQALFVTARRRKPKNWC